MEVVEINIDTLILTLGFKPFLESVINFGLKPTHYTHMMGEPTFFFKTKDEVDRGWAEFAFDGWWYTTSELEDTIEWYLKECPSVGEITVYKIKY